MSVWKTTTALSRAHSHLTLCASIAEAELMEMIERADADNDGEVTAEDFFNVVGKIRGQKHIDWMYCMLAAGLYVALKRSVVVHACAPVRLCRADYDQEDFCVGLNKLIVNLCCHQRGMTIVPDAPYYSASTYSCGSMEVPAKCIRQL